MSLEEVQETLAKLAIDSTFREQFFEGRSPHINSLSPAAKALLCAISRDEVERFARSLHGKRRTEILPLIPFTTAVLGARLETHLAHHFQRYQPTGLLKPGDDAWAFCDRLSRDAQFTRRERELFRWEASRWAQCNTQLSRKPLVFRMAVSSRGGTIRVSQGLTLVLNRRGAWHSKTLLRFGR